MLLNTSEKVFSLIQTQIRTDIEEVWVVALSANMQLIKLEMIFRGTLDHCLVHPRDIFRFCCMQNAAGFILFHSHPSGDRRPSSADRYLTRKLENLSEIMQIPLWDHLIITTTGYYSFANSGKLKKFKSTFRVI